MKPTTYKLVKINDGHRATARHGSTQSAIRDVTEAVFRKHGYQPHRPDKKIAIDLEILVSEIRARLEYSVTRNQVLKALSNFGLGTGTHSSETWLTCEVQVVAQ